MNREISFPSKCSTLRRKLVKLAITCGICFTLISVFGIFFLNKFAQKGFTPPPFEESAVAGEPSPLENLNYSEMVVEDGYKVKICASPQLKDSKATVYITNPADNYVWLRLVLLDSNLNKIGETGIIKQGFYLKDVDINDFAFTDYSSSNEITMKVMAYAPEEYQSKGSVELKTDLKIT